MEEEPVRLYEGHDLDREWARLTLYGKDMVRRALEAGEAMIDPHLAGVAAGRAERQLGQMRRAKWILIGSGLILVVGFFAGEGSLWLAATLLAGGVANWRIWTRRHQAYRSAEALNRAVVHAYWAERDPPPPVRGTLDEAMRWSREQLDPAEGEEP